MVTAPHPQQVDLLMVQDFQATRTQVHHPLDVWPAFIQGSSVDPFDPFACELEFGFDGMHEAVPQAYIFDHASIGSHDL